jgi:VanZ family protein
VSARIKIVAVIYIFILAGIVVLADVRQTQFIFNFVRSLPFGDKIGHFFLMEIFSLLVNLALRAKPIRLWKFKYLLGSLIVLAIVTLEEFSQIFVRGRTFDAEDLIVDFAGIFISGELARLITGRFSRS